MSDTEVTFECTQTKVQIHKWYAVSGAENMRQNSNSTWIMPKIAKFTFEDGECSDVFVSGVVIRKDGTPGGKWQSVGGIYVWDKQNWPVWLWDLFRTVCADILAK